MVKKKHSWGKGYKRRQQEAQRKESEQAYHGRKEGRRMAKDFSQQDLSEAYQEADLATWQRKEEQYKAAWEAEKKVSQAYSRNWTTAIQRQATERQWAAFRGVLVGLLAGVVLGLVIGAIIQ